MSRDDDERPLAKAGVHHEVGQVLDTLSVEDLRARIELLRQEILRLDAAIASKLASRGAADAFFKR